MNTLFLRWLLLSLAIIAPSAQAKLEIFTCEPEWSSLAEAVGGDLIRTYNATLAQQDPHHIQARPGLISAVRRADLVFCTGAGLEQGWLPLLLSKSANNKVQTAPGLLLAAEQVSLLDRPQQLDRSQGDIHAAGNPHMHLDPERLMRIAEILKQHLQQLDPNHKMQYEQNWQQFHQHWTTAMQKWKQQATSLVGKKAIVHHRSWIYLLQWLGIEQVAELEPKPGLPPTPSHLQSLIQISQSQDPAWIIYGPANSPKAAEWLSKRTGICAIQLPFTVGGNKQTNNLFDLFEQSIQLLLNADCDTGD